MELLLKRRGRKLCLRRSKLLLLRMMRQRILGREVLGLHLLHFLRLLAKFSGIHKADTASLNTDASAF